jgi:hypothetical protein
MLSWSRSALFQKVQSIGIPDILALQIERNQAKNLRITSQTLQWAELLANRQGRVLVSFAHH